MEREMLNILDWDLSVHEKELLAHHKFLPVSTVSTTSAPQPRKLLPLHSAQPKMSPSILPRPTPISFVPGPIPIPRSKGSASPRLVFGPGVRVARAWPSPASSLASSTSSPTSGNRLGVLSIANHSSSDSFESPISSYSSS
jgi:hypothetical protein